MTRDRASTARDNPEPPAGVGGPLQGGRLARAGLLYLFLTLLLTWPLAARLHLMDAGDSAFFAWAIGWELHALGTDPASLPHGPIFHPLPFTLGMDEPVLGTTLLVAPLALFTDDAVLLYNVARLLTFFATACTTYLLARGLGCAEAPALLAGAAFAFSPIRTDQIAHLSTLGTQWLALVLLYLFRFFREGRRLDAVLAALFFVLEALACGYHGVIGLVILPVAALPLFWGRLSRAPGAALGMALAGVALLPVWMMHRSALAPLQYARGTAETVHYSAALETFLATSSWNWLYGEVLRPFRDTEANNLFPGFVLPVLAAAGAYALWRAGRRPSREAAALGLIALAAVLVALGPEVRLFGRTLFPGPFGALRDLVPVFTMIRVPSRAGVYLALPLALLAAKALTVTGVRPFHVALLGVLALAETVIAPIPMPGWSRVVDTRRAPPPVYQWLAAQPGRPAVIELPLLDIDGILERPAYHESIYLVHQTRHWKPLLNGYAGIEPPHYVRLRESALRFPSAASLSEFRGLGARYVIVHRGGYGPNKWARVERDLPAFASELREVARFGEDVVYELLPASPGPS